MIIDSLACLSIGGGRKKEKEQTY